MNQNPESGRKEKELRGVLTVEEVNPQGGSSFSCKDDPEFTIMDKKAAKLFNYLTTNDNNKQKS